VNYECVGMSLVSKDSFLSTLGPYQPSNDTKLKFYGLFKQATEGTCDIPKPAFYDVVGRYKWSAWKANGSMSKEDAMLKYIESLKEVKIGFSVDRIIKYPSIASLYFFCTRWFPLPKVN
jgi:acyl-CoA-binding protein